MDKKEFIETLGEGFHTAFRKIPVKNASKIHKLIKEMSDEDWQAVLEFVYEGLPKKYYKLE